jgi:type IV fimbrial biogenesis protein FimT
MTLVELAIGLAIFGVLLGIAAPIYARYIAEQKLLGEARRLSDAIMLARSEAVKRNGFVVLCAGGSVASCGDAEHWHGGWTMFVDADADAAIGSDEAVIGTEGEATDAVTLVGNTPVKAYFRFDFMGRARLVSGALQMGTVEVCRPGFRGYRVVLANSGRTRIDRAPGPCA